MGLLAGVYASMRMQGKSVFPVPPSTAHGALIRHITESEGKHFQPSNINFGLFPASETRERIRDKKVRRTKVVEQALEAWKAYVSQVEAA